MRKLQKLIAAERSAFSPYSSLSSMSISRIALNCRKDEVADAHILIMQFKSELATVPDWDGDTQDDIWRAIQSNLVKSKRINGWSPLLARSRPQQLFLVTKNDI